MTISGTCENFWLTQSYWNGISLSAKIKDGGGDVKDFWGVGESIK